MGKLKISKTKKSRSTKGTSGIPNWLLSTIIIVVVIAVLAVCISTAIFSTGIIGRWSTAMKIGDIKVTQNMMSYFFRTTYSNYLNQVYQQQQQLAQMYEQMGMSSSSVQTDPYVYLKIDSTKSLKDQKPENQNISWYDYILKTTQETVSQYLVYAAAAKDAKVELTEADETAIDATVDNIILSIRYSTGASTGYSDDDCCALAYGDGVKRSDVRDAIALQTLAEKMSNTKGEEIESAVKGDDDLIKETYDKDSKLFNYANYLIFSFDVHYDDVAKDKYPDKEVAKLTDEEKATVLKIYNEKIETARKNAEELAKKKTVKEYNEFVTNFVMNEENENIYKSTIGALKSEALPKEESLKTIKEKVVANVLAEIAEGKTTAKEDTSTKDVTSADDSTKTTKEYYIYDIKIEKEFYDAVKSYKTKLFSTIFDVLDACDVERATYYEPEEENEDKDTVSTWVFDSDRKALDSTKIESGDGSDGKAVTKVTDNSFSAEVVLLTKPSYKVETLSRDFAYLLFTKKDAATAAIEAIKKLETINKDTFLALADDEKNPADAYQFIEDCVIYSMGSEEFDKWLFEEGKKPGSYTGEPLVMEDGSYMVALYVKQNSTPEWKYRVINKLIEDDYKEFEDGIFKKYDDTKIGKSPAVMSKLEDKSALY